MVDSTEGDKDTALSKGAERREIVTRNSGFSSFTSAVTATYFGTDVNGKGVITAPHREQFGFTFFSKPQLNLSYDNCVRERVFTELLTKEKYSRNRAIRAMLDPQAASRGVCDTPLIDKDYPYIPLLGNTLKSLTGWRDPFVDTYTSPAGVQKEQWSMIDGPAKFYGTFDLNASFSNIVTDPHPLLFMIWTMYPSLTRQGKMDPYPEAIIRHEKDYETSIIRFVMDVNKQYIVKWMSVPAAFPISNPIGSSGNFNSDTPMNQEGEEYSISFRCQGAEYYDPIILEEFNLRQYIYNPALMPGSRANNFLKVSFAHRNIFNRKMYPLVNLDTKELEWYVPKAIYNKLFG